MANENAMETLGSESRFQEIIKYINDDLCLRIEYMRPKAMEEYSNDKVNEDMEFIWWRMKDLDEDKKKTIKEELLKKTMGAGGAVERWKDRMVKDGWEKEPVRSYDVGIKSAVIYAETKTKIESLLVTGGLDDDQIRHMIEEAKGKGMNFSAELKLLRSIDGRKKVTGELVTNTIEKMASLQKETFPASAEMDKMRDDGLVLAALIKASGEGINAWVEKQILERTGKTVDGVLGGVREYYSSRATYYTKASLDSKV
ncbi:TPA: hypothetical protein DIU27_05540 [Candidatus Collierbacteria bacterium]|nr:hypothetical protein [Candidatus Collierbacteria bacterium]